MDFAKTSEDKLLLSRLYDSARIAEKSCCVKATNFLNGRELNLAQKALSGNVDVCFLAYGGYDEAERKVIAFYPEYLQPEYDLGCVKLIGKDLDKLSHRDYLGSVLSLGLEREKIGDLITGSVGYIICKSEITDYILTHLEKIANKPIKPSICSVSEIIVPQKKFKEISATVSSLRLDCVVSAALGISRGDASSLIKSGRVSVNWEEITSISYNLEGGELISARGFGRIELSQIKGKTRKGRIAVDIKRFI